MGRGHGSGLRVELVYFSWGWCTVRVLSEICRVAYRTRVALPISMNAGMCQSVCVLLLLFALFQRICALPVAPRLLTLLATGMGITTIMLIPPGGPPQVIPQGTLQGQKSFPKIFEGRV